MFGVIVKVACRGMRGSAAVGRPTGPAHPGGADTAQAEFVICDESIEQDHRGSEQRHSSTGGLKSFVTAARFCLMFDEIRTHLRP
jgi:hypothetical protein